MLFRKEMGTLMLPLEGIRVIDLSRLLPGAFCSQILGDFGAEVIKVEDTNQGDYSRWCHPTVSDAMIDDTISAYFAVLNRNKKSIKINLKTAEGREVFLRLVDTAGVILESFRPGVMDRLGVGYELLRQRNPKLVYCALTGYGQHGPYRDLAGHDINYLALAGVLGMQGSAGGDPILSGVQIADIGGGALMAVIGILLALAVRERTGRGQFVDIAMLDGAVSWLAQHAGNYFATGRLPERGKMILNGGYACYNVYRTKDNKYMALGALEEKFWAEFCRAVGRDDLIDRQYVFEEQESVIAELQRIFQEKTCAEWMEVFREYDTCITPVLELDEVVNDPQVLHRKMIIKVPEEGGRMLYQLGNPIKLSETPAQIRLNPPKYGENSVEILRELGYESEEIENLFNKGVC